MSRLRPMTASLLAALALLAAAAGAGAAAPDTLAILNLRPTNFEAMGYNGEILYALISALEGEKTVELVPRRQMEDKLFQAGLVQGDTPEMAMEAGKVLGIRFILFGNVTKEGGRIRANLNLMDVQSRKVVRSWAEDYGSREDILARIPELAGALASTIARSEAVPSTPAVEAAPSRTEVSLEMFRAVSEGDRVVLRWQVLSGAPIAGYSVYRATEAGGPYQFVGRTDASEFEDAGIRKGGDYFYRIGVLLGSGEEVKQELTAQIRNAGEKRPHPPLILGAEGHIRRIEIKYVPNLLNDQERFNISEYRIYRRSDPAADWVEIAAEKAGVSSQSGLGLTYEDTDELKDGGQYYYAISSIDKKDRESPLSDPVPVRCTGRPQLRLERERLLRRVELTWQTLENVEGYYLYRKQAPGSWERVNKIRSQPEFPFIDEDDLEDGQRYAYRLTAYDAEGETGPSNVVSAVTKKEPPPPQDVIAQSGMVKSVQLTWTVLADPDVGGYAVYRGRAPDSLEPLTKVKGHGNGRFFDKGSAFSSLEDGTDYYYRIASYNRFGAEGPKTPVVRARTKPLPAPAAGIRLTTLADRIQVSWQRNSEPDIAAYTLYRSAGGGGWSRVAETGPEQTVYSDTDLKPDTEYRYRIVVEDAEGLESVPAESGTIASPLVDPER